MNQETANEILDQHEIWRLGSINEHGRADFSKHDLTGLDFSNRDLTGAIIALDGLANAKLTGAIMPNGQPYISAQPGGKDDDEY